jgi:electron transfer flavoprotein alpha subunit
MSNVLFLANTEADGSLSRASLEALSAAIELSKATGATLSAGLFGAETQAAAGSIANAGAATIYAVTGAEFAQPRYATDAAAAEALARAASAEFIVATGTSRLARILAGVSQRLGGVIDTHISAISTDGSVSVTRWFYRQRIEGSLSREARPWVLQLDPGTQTPWSGAAGTATVQAVAVTLPDNAQRTKVEGIEALKGTQQTIRPEAKLLFVAGAGWTKKQKDGQPHAAEAETLILEFLNKSQASLGGSKSVVDLGGEGQPALGFMSHLNQVGQTGSSPRHPKGLSTCCHGEEPHVVGWRFIGQRRAINLDANCGWAHGKADVLYVADAFEVMKKLNELMAK